MRHIGTFRGAKAETGGPSPDDERAAEARNQVAGTWTRPMSGETNCASTGHGGQVPRSAWQSTRAGSMFEPRRDSGSGGTSVEAGRGPVKALSSSVGSR